MPATDALFLKNELMDDLTGNDAMKRFMQGYIDSFGPKGKVKGLPTTSGIEPVFRPGTTGASLAATAAMWLRASEVFYLDARMHPLVTAAAESMPDEPLLPQDLPTSQGFLWIPGGIANVDIRGQVLKFNAISWSVYGGKVTLLLWSDKHDPDDPMREHMQHIQWDKVPRLTLAHVGVLRFGQPVPHTLAPNFLLPPEVPIKVINTDQGYTVAFGKGYDDLQERLGDFKERPDPVLVWLITCWRLMQQSVTEVEREFPTRQQRRQLVRQNRPDVPVSVIRLRRSKSNYEPEHSEVNWTHRWLVRGHWRRQPYKGENGTEHRYIWIHPFVKGPEDAPLLVRDHIYSLER
jgi:hypothetical protein